MAVSSTYTLVADDFTRFPRVGKSDGLVGTLDFDAEDTGEAGGGTMTIRVTHPEGVWGFRPFLILTGVAVSANTDPGNVQVNFEGAGNKRGDDLVYGFDPIATGANFVTPTELQARVLIEPADGAANFLTVVFDTNTDATVYHVHCQGLVYDGEILARGGDYGPMVEKLS